MDGKSLHVFLRKEVRVSNVHSWKLDERLAEHETTFLMNPVLFYQ